MAVAGDCRDESVIRKVDTFNEAYRMKEKGAVLNWFDIEEPEGRLSLNSKMGDVMATLQGKLIFTSLLTKIPKPAKGDSNPAASMKIDDSMIKMLSGFSVLRLINMAGGMLGMKLTKEELLDLNAKLNKIKAPK